MQARNVTFQLVLCGVLSLASLCAFAQSDDGEPAPNFVAKTIAGEKFTNESVKGKVVLLQFWTTWRRYCRSEQSLLDEIDREFAGKGLLVLAVDVGESKKKVAKYLEQNPGSCRIVLTEDTNLAARFAATRYPLYVLVDRDGKIAGTQRGAAGEAGLRRLLGRAGLE